MKVVGMVPVYNEEDIIAEVVEHLISQAIELIVLDNGSTDNSYEICKKFADKGLIKLYQYKSNTYQVPTIFRMLYDLALTRDPDWIILSAADEILESGIGKMTLKEAIAQEDVRGYNLIQFDCFEFFLTNNDNESAPSIREKLPYYSWQHDLEFRAWKFIPGTRVEDAGGHLPIFPDEQKYLVSPRKFVMRHYNFRSEEQARRKIRERISRTRDTVQRKLGWHVHYESITKLDYPVIADHRLLMKYQEDNRWNCERKFHPYDFFNWGERNAKDMFFDKDGELKLRYPTITELKLQLRQKDQRIRILEEGLEKKMLQIEHMRENLRRSLKLL